MALLLQVFAKMVRTPCSCGCQVVCLNKVLKVSLFQETSKMTLVIVPYLNVLY